MSPLNMFVAEGKHTVESKGLVIDQQKRNGAIIF